MGQGAAQVRLQGEREAGAVLHRPGQQGAQVPTIFVGSGAVCVSRHPPRR